MATTNALPNFRLEDDVEIWLSKKPDHFAKILATRSAIRIFPLLRGAFTSLPTEPENGWAARTFLQMFRALAFSFVVSDGRHRSDRLWSTEDVAQAAEDAAKPLARDARNVAFAIAYSAFAASGNNIPHTASVAISTALTFDPVLVVDAFEEAIEQDVLVFSSSDESVFSASIERSRPWIKSSPRYVKDRWREICSWLNMRREGWKVWIDWYEAVIAGRTPWPEAAAVEIVTLPDQDWEEGPASVNRKIKEILARHRRRSGSANRPPEPAAAAGPDIEFRNGKLALVGSIPSKSGFDAVSQNLLHDRLKSRLPLLGDLSNRTGNTFPGLKLAVDEYASMTSLPLDQLDTEDFWMSGLALLTLAQAFERQDPASGHGRLDAQHQAILSEIAGLHGGLILGLPKGRMLTERAREAQLPSSEILEPATVALLDAFKENRRLLEERLRRFMETSRETIRIAGWDAMRAGYGAYALVRNTLIRMGTAFVSLDKLAAKSFVGSAGIAYVGTLASQTFGIGPESFAAMIEFFRANYGSILQYAAPFPELRAWIAYVMEFLDHDRGR
jgi:hypothetical protein